MRQVSGLRTCKSWTAALYREIFSTLFLTLLFPMAVASRPHITTAFSDYAIERYLNVRSASSVSLSPAGDRIAFLTNITGTQQVWMIDSNGGWPEQLTFYPDSIDFVSWSPDGSGLLFAKSAGGNENAQLFWLSPDGSSIRPLTNDPQVRYNFGGWSYDGKQISYSSNKRKREFFDVYVMNVASGREEIAFQQDGSNDPLAWSLDDKQVTGS